MVFAGEGQICMKTQVEIHTCAFLTAHYCFGLTHCTNRLFVMDSL